MKKGFTLLEILISVSIAGAMGILIAQVFFTTARSNNKTEIIKDVKQNGEFAIGIMERMIRNALKINTVCTPAGTTASSLEIVNANGDTTTLGCLLDGTVTRIASASGTGTTEYLTSSNVTIGGDSCAAVGNSLSFVCTSSPDEASSVSVTFSLSQAGAAADQSDAASVLFQTTATPRN